MSRCASIAHSFFSPRACPILRGCRGSVVARTDFQYTVEAVVMLTMAVVLESAVVVTSLAVEEVVVVVVVAVAVVAGLLVTFSKLRPDVSVSKFSMSTK